MPYREVVVEREAPLVRDKSSTLIIGVLAVLTVALLIWLFLLGGTTGRVTDVGPRNVPADTAPESTQQQAPAQSTQTESDDTKAKGSGASSVQTDSGAEAGGNQTVTQSVPQ